MERIGLAASKIAKGNIVMYNFYVVLIAFLFSFLVFLIAGSTVLFTIIIMRYVGQEITHAEIQSDWSSILMKCMVTLTILIGIFNVWALIRNLKLKKS